jgi:uncharacterized membrane protein YhaH (DUF805 family)
VTFGEAVAICLRRYADFSGRARRPEFWWFFLFALVLGWSAAIVDAALFEPFGNEVLAMLGLSGPVSSVTTLFLITPSLAVGARRLHDVGRSGWWQLLLAMPCLGLVILIGMWARRTDRWRKPELRQSRS